MSENLPLDILLNIFFRLPVKSILRCQAVSRRWRSIIFDPKFITGHTNHAVSKFIMLSTPNARTFTHLSINATDSHSVVVEWEDSIPFHISSTKTRIDSVSSCNGLLFIAVPKPSGPGLILCNPSIRKHFEVRGNDSPGYPKPPDSSTKVRLYGLGFDSVNNDYKVLEILIMGQPYWARPKKSIASLFSMKSNTWNCVEDFPYCIDDEVKVAWTNGSFHFIGKKTNETSVENIGRIIALNPSNEKIHLVPWRGGLEINSRNTRLTVLYDCLCVVEYSSSKRQYDIWILKEYGVKSSWMLLDSILYCCSRYRRPEVLPLSVMEGGELLLRKKIRGGLKLYDPHLNRTRNVIIDPSNELCLYKETLVWPTIGRNLKVELKRLLPRFDGYKLWWIFLVFFLLVDYMLILCFPPVMIMFQCSKAWCLLFSFIWFSLLVTPAIIGAWIYLPNRHQEPLVRLV